MPNYKPITLNITAEEYLITKKLKEIFGITQIQIFRRALRLYEEEGVGKMGQNNVS